MYVYDIAQSQWFDIGNAAGQRVNGVMADRDGNIWGAGSDPCRLVHVDAKTRTYINPSIPLPGCSQPWGVSIDVDGFVWVVDMSANMAFKVNPDTYQVELTVGGLINPYTYSDMTGAGLNLQVNPPG
jgi:streptogramin lyase